MTENEVDYDPVSAETLADPWPAYQQLRSECPVHLHEGLENPVYTFSRRGDVQSVLTDPGLWSNRHGPGVAMGGSTLGDLQQTDPPEHEIRRRFLRSSFLPRAVEQSRPRIEALARSLAEELKPRGHAELHDEFALPLPVQALVELMGISEDDGDNLKQWADALTLGMTYPEQARDARRAMTAYTVGQVRSRREAAAAANLEDGEDPVGTVVPEGLLSHLACHTLEDGTVLPDDEVAGMLSQLLVAGHETTTSLITNAMWRLLQAPERWQRVVNDHDLIPNVIEESLRFDPPVLGLCKTNNEPIQRHGVEIPTDSKVMILYASANRDEDLFSGPDEFVVDRPLLESKRHLSFGWGTHFCLGAHLARLTGRIALSVLVETLPDMVLERADERIGAPFLWGRSRLDVRWG